MKNLLMKLWKEEEGAETAEWLVIVALILGVAVIIYQGVLATELTGIVTAIGGILTGAGL